MLHKIISQESFGLVDSFYVKQVSFVILLVLRILRFVGLVVIVLILVFVKSNLLILLFFFFRVLIQNVIPMGFLPLRKQCRSNFYPVEILKELFFSDFSDFLFFFFFFRFSQIQFQMIIWWLSQGLLS